MVINRVRVPRPLAAWRCEALLSVVLAAALAGCAGNPVRVEEVPLEEAIARRSSEAWGGANAGERARSLLDRLGLPIEDYGAGVERLAQPIESVSDRERLLARAQLNVALAARSRDVYGAADRVEAGYLAAALDAWAAFRSPADPSGARGRVPDLDPLRYEALLAYDFALTRFLLAVLGRGQELPELTRHLGETHGIHVEWAMPGRWGLFDFDEWRCARILEFEGIRHRYERYGIGVPLVLERDPQREIPPYLTPEGVMRSATAVLLPGAGSFTGSSAGHRLRILEPRTVTTLALGADARVPLAGDFTAPFAWLIANARLHELEDRGFFGAEVDDHEGLFLLEDYDSKRRPVVMVHGLWSSPLTWRDLTNDIFGDPSLHDDYQVWHYFYATGVPLLENARRLREALQQVRKDLDPEGDDPAMRDMVLVGHSMGGLLTRIALSSSGTAIWDTLFERSFDEVAEELGAADRSEAQELYFWEPLPFVSRAVFLAAPHRGSEMADGFIGRLGSSLMAVPGKLRRLVDRIRGRSAILVEVPTSVDELSASHPVMVALGGLPMREGLRFHTVVGDVSGSEDPEEWTDGIVPYRSSSLEGADSELVVEGADHSVHFDPRAAAEVRRILRGARPDHAPGR